MPSSIPPLRFRSLALVATLGLALTVTAGRADDRELFFNAGESPYIFVILDTSGSMNWALTGGFNSGDAPAVDPVDSLLPGAADDPRSRGYQAKSAIFEVVRDTLPPDARIGFAHFDHPNAKVTDKHWIYTPVAPPSWASEFGFPLPGQAVRFGEPPGGYRTGDLIQFPVTASCTENQLTGTTRLFGILQQLPKLGRDGTDTTVFFVKPSGQDETYRVEVAPLAAGQSFGSLTLDVTFTLEKCSDGTRRTEVVSFEPFYESDPNFLLPGGEPLPITGPSDFLAQDWRAFRLNNLTDHVWDDPCVDGWADNSAKTGNPLAYPSFADPLGRGEDFARGDMIPWDWVEHPLTQEPAPGFEISAREEFLRRLAPNIAVAGEHQLDDLGRPIPDFRIARYFQNTPIDGALPLKTAFADNPPIAFFDSTPLAKSLSAFEEWFLRWEPEAKAAEGQRYECRERFVVLLTDGVESCGGDPALAAGSLRQAGVRTLVVGFGPGVESGDLQAIADAGGTGAGQFFVAGTALDKDCQQFVERDPDTGEPLSDCTGPIMAANRDDLVRALSRVFRSVLDTPASFSAAGLPAGGSEAADSLFLASFTPSLDAALWPGSLQHWVRPLPEQFGDPDFTPVPNCPSVDEEGRIRGCFAWDAAIEILKQVPSEAEIEVDQFRLGFGLDERRIFWTPPPNNGAVPRRLELFGQASDDATRHELWMGLGIGFTPGDPSSEELAAAEAQEVVRQTVRLKYSDEGPFVLGDIFHSSPVVVGAPSNLPLLLRDPADVGDCIAGPSENDVVDPATSYGCYFKQNRFRRQILLAGANDGQLHAFDAGRFQADVSEYGVGTGREIFSYIPSFTLPRVGDLARGATSHQFSVDGPIEIGDAFIDPRHAGLPNADDRRWRTVAIAGLREGERGVYALDLTRPDAVVVETFDNVDPLLWEIVPDNSENVENAQYLPQCFTPGSGENGDCEPTPYPSALWEFADIGLDNLPRDDDANGFEDLGFTWSTPQIGRIPVLERPNDQETVLKSVAIFGGGLDPRDEAADQVGNWLYMVDIETGHAIYKRRLDGSAAAPPAVVDTNGDTVTDTIYIGTTAGFLYKVDLSAEVVLEEDATVPGGLEIEDPLWDPFPILDTGGRPIFQEPSVVFIARRGLYALAVGTGEREDLFASQTSNGRFYVVVDTFERDPLSGLPPAPFGDTDLTAIGILADGTVENTPVDITSPLATGYFFTLEQDERTITKALTIGGVTVFSSFLPEPVQAEGNTCITVGISRIYSFFVFTGDSLIENAPIYSSVQGVVAGPWAETGLFDVGSGSGDGDPDDPDQPPTPEEERLEELASIRSTLMSMMSDRCRFNNLTINMSLRRQDTGVEWVAPIPVCQQIKNWAEL